MRESTKTGRSRKEYRHQLLTTVSAAVLLVSAYGIGSAEAADSDADRAPIWIELGGQLSRLDNNQEIVTPPFFASSAGTGLDSPAKFETPPQYSIDEYGKLSFRPGGSDWVFSASIQYGKSSNKNQVHEKGPNLPISFGGFTILPTYGAKFGTTQWSSTEKHVVLDFRAGKDVGLGMFGGGSSSEIDLGVRFAQFSSKSTADINADPTLQYPTHPVTFFSFFYYSIHHNLYSERDYNERSFHGVGPSISWKGSTPIAGNTDGASLALDWGLNAAVLFGRQKARGHHQSSEVACPNYGYCQYGKYTTTIGPYKVHNRSRNVTVPNIGGSLGLSFQSGNAKINFGYRADLFIGAMDDGIDTRKLSNMLFHGPFASISVGIGD